MIGLKYRLHLLEPVLAAGLEGDPNTNRSLPYIPGSLVRGALIAAYLREEGRDQLITGDETERRMFLDGSVRFLNAYPQDNDGRRFLPTPLSWYHPKNEKLNIFDFSLDQPILDQPKQSRGFALESGGKAAFAKPHFQVNVHTQRDAEYGRAREGSGAVFRYEALPAGMLLNGVILADNEDDAEKLRRLITSREHLLGGARTAGYGRVRFTEVEDLEEGWREPGTQYSLDPDHTYKHIIARCLSHVILMDHHGRTSVDLVGELSRSLGASIQAALDTNHNALIFSGFQDLGGFNRKWGLPLSQQRALSAGSVFVIKISPGISGESLLELEMQGCGLRRAEGFGRVAFLDPAELSKFLRATEVDPAVAPVSGDYVLSPEAEKMAHLMIERRLRADLEDALNDAVNNVQISGKPSRSQLSRWRVLARSALARGLPDGERQTKELARLKAFLMREKERSSPAWQGFLRTRISRENRSVRLTEWLENLLEDEKTLWAWMTKPGSRQLGEEISTHVTPGLIFEYRLRLLDAVLASAGLKSE